MNRNSKILIFVFLLLGIVAAGIIYKSNQKQEPSFVDPLLKDRNFAYENIDEIDRIVIKRKKYPKLVFSKSSEGWLINDRFKANEETMPHLLAVLKGVKMKYIPPESMRNTIDKDLAKDGIEVMLYHKDGDLVRNYLIGTEFGDGSDTPFLMVGSKQPFIVYLPGLDGSVRRRFNYNIAEWKSKTVFQEEVDKIKKVEVVYPQDKSSGFTITKYNDGFKLLDEMDKTPARIPNQNTMAAFFDFFTFIRGESNETENPERKRIEASTPFCKLTLLFKDNTSKTYTFYSMGDLTGDFVTKSPGDVHIDNKFFISMPDGELLMAQYRVLNKILKPIWYFF